MSAALTLFSGPCLVESREMIFRVAETLAEAVRSLEIDLVLKGSFVKANRTKLSSPTTIGREDALKHLRDAGREYGLRTVTDVHTLEDVELASRFVDVLQIPAFLCRQTDLLIEAGRSSNSVMIKKGQFVAPEDMGYAVEKVRSGGADDVWVCERGTMFGYHNLVVDMRGLVRMRDSGARVMFDATHSTQQPSMDGISGGEKAMALPLARAAAAVGIDGLFFETHPDPAAALSDSATQVPLDEATSFIEEVLRFHQVHRSHPLTKESSK